MVELPITQHEYSLTVLDPALTRGPQDRLWTCSPIRITRVVSQLARGSIIQNPPISIPEGSTSHQLGRGPDTRQVGASKEVLPRVQKGEGTGEQSRWV